MDNVEVYEDDIDLALSEYLEIAGITDKSKITSSSWCAAMIYIGNRLFKNGEVLRQSATWNNEPYDLDKVSALADKYIFLCSHYNQRVCVAHFCSLSGVDSATIYQWGTEARRAGDKRAKAILEKLIEAALVSADDLMLSKSGVNSIAYRNAVNERYANREQKTEIKPELSSLASRLGITGQQKALPEPEQGPEQIEVKKPWETGQFDFI